MGNSSFDAAVMMPNQKGCEKMRIVLYGNGGSCNHGCEAIVRGTVQLCGEQNDYIVMSTSPKEDYKYGLNEIATITPAKAGKREPLPFIKAYWRLKVKNDYVVMDSLPYLKPIQDWAKRTDVAFSIGGDNYCYGGTGLYANLNQAYHNNGVKTVFWGCSVEPEVVEQTRVVEDLRLYNQIVTREEITYQAIKKVKPQTWLMPDPAFYMKSQNCEIDKRYEEHQVIGINISPMIISYEKQKGNVFENYVNLIRWILDNTEYDIALIPHVVLETNDDRIVLRQLYESFEDKERLILEKDHSAPELKYIISKCYAMVAARTHASIAAYSMGIPTLVVGYSVKARGIAYNLFGNEKEYVLPVQELKEPRQLCDRFQRLILHHDEIKEHLCKILPDYLMQGREVMRNVFAELQ